MALLVWARRFGSQMHPSRLAIGKAPTRDFTGHTVWVAVEHDPEGGLAASKCRRPPICEFDAEVHPRRVHIVLLEDGGSGDTRVVIRRVRAADRLIARLRSSALDRGLAAGQSPDSSAALALRARVLLSSRTRRRMARSLRQLPRYVEPAPAAISPFTLVRQRLRAAEFAFEELAERLEGDQPVDVRGVALARVLLANGAGAPYSRARADAMLRAVGEALRALTPV
jgi:hypothetical protein